MAKIAEPRDYWIAPSAIYITLNALGNPDRIQGNVASGAAILCYIKGVQGLEYDNGHNYKSWPLSLSPTYFNTSTEKYIYAAIPKNAQIGTQAVIVFPSQKIDVNGQTEQGEQIGSTDYYYIWLQGIISASIDGSGATQEREWLQQIQTGLLSSDEALATLDTDWYSYSQITQIVSFLRNIAMSAGSSFLNLFVGDGEDKGNLTGVATAENSKAIPENSSEHIVTPSYLGGKFLRKDIADTATGLITFTRGLIAKAMSVFEQGAQFGTFVTGQLSGTGAQIDAQGKMEAQALTLREYLEVPELRFNRAEIIAGNTTQTPCGGIIDTVTPSATVTGEGSATLKLEEGEIGKIAVGDLCMGYWHDMSGGNASTDSDDKQGRMAFSGFKTVYFRITNIPRTYITDDGVSHDNSGKHYFEYVLRPECSAEDQAILDSDDPALESQKKSILANFGGNGIHPFQMMHFAGRGNSSDPTRQGFTIHTPTYTARLSGVSTWLFDTSNYTYVNGDLNGFGTLIDRPSLTGYGTIDMNLYMKGTIVQVDNTPDYITVSQSLMGMLNRLESQQVTFTVMDGYRQVHTSGYDFAVMRDSGDVTADEEWDAQHTTVSNPWTMSYSDLAADRCVFTVIARNKTDHSMLQEQFVARKNHNLRYYLTLNTDLIHVDMNGDLADYGTELEMTRGDYEEDENNNYLTLTDLYLTTNQNSNGHIIARAWRQGGSTTSRADSTDGLLIRTTVYTGIYIETGATSTTGIIDITADLSCDKYILELVDASQPELVYDTKTVVIVRDGSASVIADFDDEMGAGAAASDGTMLAGIPYESVAHLYRGSSIETLTNAEMVDANGVTIQTGGAETQTYVWTVATSSTTDPTTEVVTTTKTYTCTRTADSAALIVVSLVYSSGSTDCSLTLSTLHKDAPDNNKFGIRLTSGSEANVAYFYFNKYKAGSDGHVTLYQLAPDTTAIKINKNGQYSTSTVTVGVLKIDVDETGQTETNLAYADYNAAGLSVKYKVDGAASWSNYTQPFNVGTATQKVELQLTGNNNILWDTETIPVIRDGQDSNYVMKFASVKIEDNPDDERWHSDFRNGDTWAIMSSDGGEHWNGPYPIVGEEGKPGDYTEFSFGISSYSITANATESPSDIGGNNNPWHDGVINVTTDKPYLWMRTGKFVWNATLNNGAGGHELDGDYTYARVKGVDAPDRYELEVSDKEWQIAQDGTTVTPTEIYIKAARVKADGTRTYLTKAEWPYGSNTNMVVTLTVSLYNGTVETFVFDGSTSEKRFIDAEFSDNALMLKTVLTNKGNSYIITNLKSVAVKCDFKKDGSVLSSVTETFSVLRSGRDGAIAVIADLDDEMISIPVQSDGSGAVWPNGGWTTRARLYRGTEMVSIDDAYTDTPYDGIQGITFNISNSHASGPCAIVTISGFTSNDTQNRKVPIHLVSNTYGTASCTAYVNKIPAGVGGDGKDAVLYQLALSSNAIHTDANGNITSSIIITGQVFKYKGEDQPTKVTDGSVWVIVKGSDGADKLSRAVTGDIYISLGTKCTLSNFTVSIYPLKNGSADTTVLLDQETIPVLKDGAKGDKGDDGDSIALEYSPNGTSNWNSTFRAGTDLYAREYKLDANGNRISGSEGAAFRIVGEQGIQGPDGKPGDYTDYSFGRSAQSTTTNSSTAPEIDGSWNDGVPVPSTAYPYIWMRKRLMTWNATKSQYVEVADTTRYIRVTGEKGDKGEDGKDAAAYEFTRFSDDARLVNGVWTGTFTGKSDAAIQAEAAEQGDKCNLLPNTDFAEWDSENGVPAGWAMNASGVTASRITDGGKYWVRVTTNSSIRGITQSEEKENDSPLYLCPFVAGRTYTISARYKGNAIPAIGVQYYPFDSNNPQHWQSFTSEYADGEEHLLTFTFTCDPTVSATHIKVFFVSGTSGTYTYNFAQPKIEVGDTATDYTVAPAWNPRLNGTVQGLWKGIMRWGYPYASTVFSDYEWTKVRDADPRMTNWEDVTAIQQPNYNSGDTAAEQTTFMAGTYGERYYDMVYDGTDYWLCKKNYAYDFYVEVENNGVTERRYVTPSNTELWTIYWERASQFNFLMARTLFASRAYINQLGVEKLSTISQNGQVQVHDGVMEVFNAAGLVNIRFGLDANGYAVMQYFDNDGTLLYDLGPNGIASTELRQASVTRGTWYKLVGDSEFTNVLTQENIRRLFSTGITANTNYYYFLCKIVAGRKCADTATGDQGYISDDSMATPCDEHYFAKLESSSPKIRPQNYLSDGIYYNPTLTSFMRGGNGCRIRTFGGYGTPDAQYSNYASHYQAAGYAVTWPTSADDIMRNPLLYVEVYIVSGGKVSKTMKVFMRYDVYSNDDNITK